jgi:hypothetical protein
MHAMNECEASTPTRTIRKMIPSYFETVHSPQRQSIRVRGKKAVDREALLSSREYAGKRSTTPAYIRANDKWSIRPMEPRQSSGRCARFGGLPPETARMVFSSYYRPQIRVKIRYDENVETPNGIRLRLRKPVTGLSSTDCSLRGPLVASAARASTDRKHPTYAYKRVDPQLPNPHRPMTRAHPILSARMREGNDMKELISSQWQYDKPRPDTASTQTSES